MNNYRAELSKVSLCLQLYILLEYFNNFFLQMGQSCAKLQKKQRPGRVSSKQELFDLHRNSSFTSITQIGLRIYNKKKVQFSQSQYFYIQDVPVIHTQISFATQNFKYIPNIGFQKMLYGDSIQQNQIGFLVYKTSKKNLLLELKHNSQAKLWRKISLQPVQIKEQNQVLFGKAVLKLLFWLSYQQCRAARQKSNLKLPKCQDEDSECRICLQESLSGNPLLKPCNCTGSVSTIHQRCLSQWIFNNPVCFEHNMSLFKVVIKKKHCEICKSSFDEYIWNRIMNIVSSFQGHYAIFKIRDESMKAESIEGQSEEILILKFSDERKTIQLDNFSGSNYFLPQFGVNTIDALFYMEDNRLFLRDNRSNYGPFILTNNSYLNLGEEYKLGISYLEIQNRIFRRKSN